MVLQVSVVITDKFTSSELVYVKHEALTYSMTNVPKFQPNKKVLGLVIKQVEKRAKPTGNVNFDNAALYYIMTTLGCITVFEFDLEAISEPKENSCH